MKPYAPQVTNSLTKSLLTSVVGVPRKGRPPCRRECDFRACSEWVSDRGFHISPKATLNYHPADNSQLHPTRFPDFSSLQSSTLGMTL